MSDYNSSLPIRTENNGDAAVKVVDGTITSQALSVDASGKVTAKINDGAGNALASSTTTPVGTEQALIVRPITSGTQTVAGTVTANQGTPNSIANAWPVLPTDGTNSQSYTAAGEAKISVTQPLPAGTNNIGKVSIQDSSGAAISTSNPLPVSFATSTTGDIADYNTAAAVAAAATSNHTYTVTAGKTLQLTQIEASASGKAKIEVQVETGVSTNTYTTKFVQFNSTATPNMTIQISKAIAVAAGVRVRIIRTNKDNQAQDLYSTIVGVEV
jgi:hypothetical protein